MPAYAASRRPRRAAPRRRSPWCRRRGCAAASSTRQRTRPACARPAISATRACRRSLRVPPGAALPPAWRLQLVAIDDARLVGLDDRRLRERRRSPIRGANGCASSAAHVRAGGARRAQRRRCGSGTRPVRRTRRRSRSRRTGTARRCRSGARASVHSASMRAMSRSSAGRPRPHVDALRECTSSCRCAGRGNPACISAARSSARRRARRGSAGHMPAMPLGEVLGDRERIPDDDVAVVKAGHEPRRRELEERRVRAGRLEAAPASSSNGCAGQLHAQPAAQRPRRIVLVARCRGVSSQESVVRCQMAVTAVSSVAARRAPAAFERCPACREPSSGASPRRDRPLERPIAPPRSMRGP